MINLEASDWDAFDAFRQFNALKFHFAGTFIGEHGGGSYDYFKYGAKLSRFKREAFEKKPQQLQVIFHVLSNKYTNKQMVDYFVANFSRGKKYIHDFDTKTWDESKRYLQTIDYYFKNDVEKLLTDVEEFDIIFNCDEGNHPKLLRAYLGKKINLETLVILEKLLHYRKRFNIEIKDEYIWPRVSKLISRYEPFVGVDIGKCKQMLLEKATELRNE